MHRFIYAGLLVILAACQPASREAARQALLQADRDFAAATARDGIEAWVGAFADDGVQFGAGGGVVQGHDAIRRHMAAFFADPELRLDWVPTDARLDRRLGYTYGRYSVTRRGGAGGETPAVVETGTYLSVWRKGPEGWKVEADIGSPDPQG